MNMRSTGRSGWDARVGKRMGCAISFMAASVCSRALRRPGGSRACTRGEGRVILRHTLQGGFDQRRVCRYRHTAIGRNTYAYEQKASADTMTVSREHARIAWDPESDAYWLRDEGSASGTLLFRAGRSIEVSRHDRRGVRLESGDEVYLGRAAVKVEIGGSAG